MLANESSGILSLKVGAKTYELADYLGNVLVVVSDRKMIDGNLYYADLEAANRYYPFGMNMTTRNPFEGDDYRYGFQGQEEDKETGLVDYKYRMYDSRIGRFFAVDPLAAKYPYNGTYNFSENRVIDGVELEGLEVSIVNEQQLENGKTKITISIDINIVNSSSRPMWQIAGQAQDIQNHITSTYNKNREGEKFVFEFQVNIDFSESDIKYETFDYNGYEYQVETGFYMEFVDEIGESSGFTLGITKTIGEHGFKYNVIQIRTREGVFKDHLGDEYKTDFTNKKSLGRTASHELGHAMGMRHRHMMRRLFQTKSIMIQSAYGEATDVSHKELTKIYKRLKKLESKIAKYESKNKDDQIETEDGKGK